MDEICGWCKTWCSFDGWRSCIFDPALQAAFPELGGHCVGAESLTGCRVCSVAILVPWRTNLRSGKKMCNKPDRFDFVFLANCSVLAVQVQNCFPVDMKLEIKNKVPPTLAGQYSSLSCVGNRSWRFITFQHCWTWPKVQCHDAIRGHWHDPFGFTGNHFAEISICLRGFMSCGGWGCVRGLRYLIATLSLYIYIYTHILIQNISICYRYIRATRFHPKFGKNQVGNLEAMSQINEDMCIPTFLERSTIRRKRDSWSLLYSWC